jgi:DNA-binding CsgD family transcriptional regulator/tetratricopeptide (TPR) repeat protein
MLEREHELALLATAAREAAGGVGGVVLVVGEAGIGKSSLVEAVRAHLPAEGRMLVGYCDDLATKRPLGPLRDLVGSVGAELAQALRDGSDQDRVLAALRVELDWPGHPTVLVMEDVHWADDATLDALQFLMRRVARLPAVLVLTYRDDELPQEHPLQGLLGMASRVERVHRLPLRRLSVEAVRQLSADSPLDPERVYAVTAGNPFFVAEVLGSGGDATVPPTVMDAVLARFRKLDRSTREVVEQLAVVPSTLDRWLVDALVPAGLAALAATEQRGLLAVSPRRVAFRHELTRRAIADSVPAARRVELHRRVLAALEGREGADLSQLVHHAAEAGDLAAIARYGPDAARQAARSGAHHQAAAHYRLVLEQPDRFAAAERADLLQGYAIECYIIGAAERAVSAQRDAVELRRSLGEARALGASLRWLSWMHWWNGDRRSAEQAAAEAIGVLEPCGDDALLALALSNQSLLHMLAHRTAESIAVGERAAAMARAVGQTPILSHALVSIGVSRSRRGEASGRSVLEESLRLALAVGDIEDACRAYVGTIWCLLDDFRLDEAERQLAAGMRLAEDTGRLGHFVFFHVERARLALARATWDEAVSAAEHALHAQPPWRCPALTVLGRAAVRRGQPGAGQYLAEAWELAEGLGELQRTGPVAAARAEAAWLAGDLDGVCAIVAPVYAEARRLGAALYQAELGSWLARVGETVAPIAIDHPYTAQAEGRWREAAAAWAAYGCPYEQAAALACSQDPDDLLAALATLDRLGAGPLASIVRARLQTLGISRIPRGPVESTRANPAGLTGRQAQVLRLVSQGLTNAEIAERLVVSVRTVDAHVAAVLDKLGARTRREAAARAAELGALPG